MKGPRAPNYIAIEGPIGVGKSSLTLKLAGHFGAQTIMEKVEENPFLSGFYKDRRQYAFQAQMFFLLSRQKQLQEANQVNLFQKMVVADYMLEKDRLFALLNLDSEEFKLYNEIYGLLLARLVKPDLVIFLSADTDTLVRRIGKRGRNFEAGIEEKYIAEVNEAYHRWFFHYDAGPSLQVNTSGIDFVENEQDFIKLLEKISRPVKGREFFNPLGSM
ncbi:MAG: deoxynucleoside kinase [Nitrospinae bacterium]|nr:deoxynucleoside kinase [Nitrospinota bacterium]